MASEGKIFIDVVDAIKYNQRLHIRQWECSGESADELYQCAWHVLIDRRELNFLSKQARIIHDRATDF